MKKISLLGIIVLLIYGNCYKDELEPSNSELHAITTVGNNTCGCLVNDVVWQNAGTMRGAYSSTIKNEIFTQFYIYQKKDNAVLTINGRMTYTNKEQEFGMSIFDKDLPKIGNFPIKSLYFNDFLQNKKYNLIDSLRPPILQIMKFDTINRIVSGTFDNQTTATIVFKMSFIQFVDKKVLGGIPLFYDLKYFHNKSNVVL